MAVLKARLSILTFPQRWQDNKITVRALVIPRNFDPTKANEIAPATPAFCDAVMALQARFISDTDKYAGILEPDKKFPLAGVKMPAGTSRIFKDMALQLGGIKSTQTLQQAEDHHRTRKYLPESYRNSFNFTTPRSNDAVTDDSYHCAIRDRGGYDKNFKSSVDSLSWGKVFAHCLRQPVLAERVGFIYESTFAIDPNDVKQGGWLYIDLADGCSYKAKMDADQALVKRYAARIPALKKDGNRTLFAAVQFPVLINETPLPADVNHPLVPSNFDELLIEATQYDDGFCKVVHASQPVSSDLLRETEDKELPVITDAGIRLGWDDEQILAWVNRQMKPDPALTDNRRTDAPMGVMQYRVDVRLQSTTVPNPNKWIPLCKVKNKADLKIGGEKIDGVDKERELGVEVYPSQLDARPKQPFWLPQYFADWIGKSLVLPDNEAIEIFRKDLNELGGKQASKNKMYTETGLETFKLQYGKKYEFRVRLADISGGGPIATDNRIYDAPAPEAKCDFRRWVQPQTVRLKNHVQTTDADYFKHKELLVRRPLLGYPAVVFTGKYTNAIELLKKDADPANADGAVKNRREVGIPDPDVTAVEVLVEIKALEMDTLLRYNTDSQESYAKLYKTKRLFPADFNGELKIPITFSDVAVLEFKESQNLGTLGFKEFTDDIDAHKDIVLPTSRDVRITLRPVLGNQTEYYPNSSGLPLIGKPVVIITRKASVNEKLLFRSTGNVNQIRGIWLQPETNTYLRASIGEILVENYNQTNTSTLTERIAESIDKSIEVEAKGLSLVGKEGTRIQFGASRLIRNNLSPDSTSITISTKSDLLNQWIVPITLILDRDWTWDGAMPISFRIFRSKKMVGAGLNEAARNAIGWQIKDELVGDIEMKQAINVQALYNPDRKLTYLCFIDAVEPKIDGADEHPQEMMLEYIIKPNFKSKPDSAAVVTDNDLKLQLHLPITTKPAQVPKIVSAGIAQSKYVADPLYRSTEPRKRFLWIEFAEPLKNPNDSYFIRMLAYSADPLLADWRTDMFKAPEERALPVSPEPVRVISPNHTDDKPGLNAMQELLKADGANPVHYIVPLPPGIHTSSAELFGFFTYELRVGHKVGWSTAQGRFGSALRTTGVQHPPPQLFCTINRNEKHIMVTAPFAQTVFNGADVTSKPPRTQLWALLYAQVKRADDKEYRNILLDDQLFIRKKQKLTSAGLPVVHINTDAVQYGITGWKNKDVEAMLLQYGLPEDSTLSVLAVEMLPTYDKFLSPFNPDRHSDQRTGMSMRSLKMEEGMEVNYFKSRVTEAGKDAGRVQQKIENDLQSRMEEQFINEAQKQEQIRPLTEQLGTQRILRTSTLVPVPEICCIE